MWPSSSFCCAMQVLAGVGSVLKTCSSITGLARWVGYLSSTGVYGDWQGAWVDEG